jgi:hypothetical protein
VRNELQLLRMSMKFSKLFSWLATASAVLGAATCAYADSAESSKASFRLAKTDAAFYLGFEKSVSLMRGVQSIPIQAEIRRTLDGVATLTPERLSQLGASKTAPNFAFSHGFERFEIGRVNKVEDLRTYSASNTGVQAFADMMWGDTLWVSPTSASGAAVQTLTVVVERSMSGTGDASALAHYDARSNTYVNGLELPAMAYLLAKGPGGLDQSVGQAVSRSEVTVQVGTRFTLEAVLRVVDGLAPSRLSASSEYIKDGSDGSIHTVSIQPGLGLCLRSASGKFKSGDCR